jgi:DNA-binding NtrC family response regulator
LPLDRKKLETLTIRRKRNGGRAVTTSDPVLIVSSNFDYHEMLSQLVSRYGLLPVCCTDLSSARLHLERQSFSAILCEEILADGYWGMLIHHPNDPRKAPPVIVVSDRDDWDSYLAVVGIGAFDSVQFPPQTGELERCLWLAQSETRWSERKVA